MAYNIQLALVPVSCWLRKVSLSFCSRISFLAMLSSCSHEYFSTSKAFLFLPYLQHVNRQVIDSHCECIVCSLIVVFLQLVLFLAELSVLHFPQPQALLNLLPLLLEMSYNTPVHQTLASSTLSFSNSPATELRSLLALEFGV